MKAIIQMLAAVVSLAFAGPATADVIEATKVIGSAYEDFSHAASSLSAQSRKDCSPNALKEAYHETWDAWAMIDFWHLGPAEIDGRSLAISYWPDVKAAGRRGQQALIDSEVAIEDLSSMQNMSVAMRGLGGLERLIYPSDLSGNEERLCALRQATAKDLAVNAEQIAREWPEFSSLLISAGEPENTTYLSLSETQQAIYTQIMTALEDIGDRRIGRPLSSRDNPRPDYAETVSAGRSQRNIVLSLNGIRDVAMALQPDGPMTAQAFDTAIELANGLYDPVLADITSPDGWDRLDAVRGSVREIRRAAEVEIGENLGISMGFNARDGD